MLCNHHLYLVLKHFHHANRKPHTHKAVSPHSPLLPVPGNHQSTCVSMNLLLWLYHINGIIQYVTFWVWLLTLSITFSGFIHIVDVSILHSFLWPNNIPKYGSTTFLFIHSSIDGHYFHLLAIVNRPSMNVREHVFDSHIILMKLYFRANICAYHLKASIWGHPHSGAHLSVLETRTKS